MKILNNIKTRLANTYNKTETDTALLNHLPVGSIILWTPGLHNGEFPDYWQLCDGSLIINPTQDMCDTQSTLTPVLPITPGNLFGGDYAHVFLFKHSLQPNPITVNW